MAWTVSADVVDFVAAIAWFRKRVPLLKGEWADLRGRAKERAFTVSGVAQLDLVHQVWKSIDRAIATGTALDEWKKGIGAALKRAWRGSVDDPPWRLETIFRTNVQSAYSAGRYFQAKHPDIIADRPVWMFDAILDGRESPICHACDGTKRPADDAWWQEHTPPLHFNCRSSFIALSGEQAGPLTKVPTSTQADAGFGTPPSAATSWQPDLTEYPPALAEIHKDKTR
jgi:SPP1 gp7 family putative phage head morphogenesis protein